MKRSVLILMEVFFLIFITGCLKIATNKPPYLTAIKIERENSIVGNKPVKIEVYGIDEEKEEINFELKSEKNYLIERIGKQSFLYTPGNLSSEDKLIVLLTDSSGNKVEFDKVLKIKKNMGPLIDRMKINDLEIMEAIKGKKNIITIAGKDGENDEISDIKIVSEEGGTIEKISGTENSFYYTPTTVQLSDVINIVMKDTYGNTSIYERKIKITGNTAPEITQILINGKDKLEAIENTVVNISALARDAEGDKIKEITVISENGSEIVKKQNGDFEYRPSLNIIQDSIKVTVLDEFNTKGEYRFIIKIVKNSAPFLDKVLLNGVEKKEISMKGKTPIKIICHDNENEKIETQIMAKNGKVEKVDEVNYYYISDNNSDKDIVTIVLRDIGNREYKENIEISLKANIAPILSKFLVNGENRMDVFTGKSSVISIDYFDPENDEIATVNVFSKNGGNIVKKSPKDFEYTPVENINTDEIIVEVIDSKGNILKEKREVTIRKVNVGKITYMLYMGADNSLNGEAEYLKEYDYALKDIEEMLQGEVDSSRVNFIIYADFLFDSVYTRGIYKLEKTGLVKVEEIEGEPNTGNKKTLEMFINYCSENYPGERNMLSFWGHGSGWWDDQEGSNNNPTKRALSYDSTTTKAGIVDSLDLWELEEAVSSSKVKKIDMIFMDMCSMGTIEVAYQLKNVCNYLACSPELVPGRGADYKNLINVISKNYNKTTFEIASEIQDGNYKSYQVGGSQYNKTQEAVVYSIFDMAKVENIVTQINDIADILKSKKELIYSIKEKVIDDKTEKLLSYGISKPGEVKSDIDIVDFFTKLKIEQGVNGDLSTKINLLIEAIQGKDGFVNYVKSQDGIYAEGIISVNGSCGVTIFFDLKESNETDKSKGYLQEVKEYKDASRFGYESKWTELLIDYYNIQERL